MDVRTALSRRAHRRCARTSLLVTAAVVASLLTGVPGALAAVESPAVDTAATVTGSSGDVTLAWQAVEGATGYRVTLSTSSTFSPVLWSTTTPSLRATPAVALPSGTIHWRVVALEGTATSAPVGGSFTRAVVPGPALVSPGADSVQTLEYPASPPVLTWRPVPAAKTYTVELSTDDTFPGGGATKTYTTSATRHAVTELLTRGATWHWRVKATLTDNAVTTEPSRTGRFVLSWPTALAQPALEGDAATAGGPPVTDLDLRWSEVPGAARYLVEVSTDQDFASVVPGTPVTVLTNRFAPARSFDNGPYFWRVRAVDAAGNGGPPSEAGRFERAWGRTSAATTSGTGDLAAPVAYSADGTASLSAEQIEARRTTAPAESVSISDLELRWTAVPRASVYEVWVTSETSGFFTNAPQITRCYTPHTSVSTTNLYQGLSAKVWAPNVNPNGCLKVLSAPAGAPLGEYRWRVRALDLAGDDVTTHQTALNVDGNTRWIRSAWSDISTASAPARFTLTAARADASGLLPAPTAPAACLPDQPCAQPDAPTLTWTPVADATAGYWVELALDEAFTNKVGEFHTQASRLRLDGGLLDNIAGQAFWWRAMGCTSFSTFATKSCLESGSATASSFLKRGEAPVDLTSSTSGDAVTLRWQEHLLTAPAGGGTRGYEVQVSPDEKFSTTVLTAKVDQPYLTTSLDLLQDGTYFWRVRALDGAGSPLAWSAPAGASFAKSAPKPVPAPTTGAATAPALRWAAVPGTASYDVEVYNGDNLSAGGSRAVLQTGIAGTAFVPATLGPGTYSWRVRRVDVGGNVLPWSAEPGGDVQVFTVGLGPVTPTSPASGATVGLTDRALSWEPVTGAVRYQVALSTTPSFDTAVEKVDTVQTRFAPVGAYTPDTTYYWRVLPLHASGAPLTSQAEVREVRFWNVPPAPGAVKAVAQDKGLSVSWTAPTTSGGLPLAQYVVRHRPAGTDAWSVSRVSASATTTFLDELAPGTKYQVQVASRNDVGTGPFSAVVEGTTFGVPGAPTITGAVRQDRSASITWTAPTSTGGTGITSYTVVASPGGASRTVAGTVRTALVDGLVNGTAYVFTVTAANTVGSGPASAESAPVVPAGVPRAPATPTAQPGNGAATVSWGAADPNGDPVTGYTVTSSPGSKTCTTTGATTCEVTGLTNGTSYTFTAVARNGVGTGAASPASAAVVPAGVPGASGSISAQARDGAAQVSWSIPAHNGSPITGYTVTADPGGATATTTASVRTVLVPGLENGTGYTFTVTATNGVGTGPASAPSNRVVPAGLPTAPAEVVATAGNASAAVSWLASEGNGSTVSYYLVTSSPEGRTCSTTGALTCTVTGLTNGTTYTFTVTARNGVGTGPASAPSAAVVPSGVPSAPTGVTATPGAASAAVSWTAASGNGSAVTGYTVTSSPGGRTCTTTGATSCTVTGLTNGTSYTFSVTATNSTGTGPASASSAAVVPADVPSAPGGVTAQRGTAAATVSWTAASGNGAAVTGYTVTASPGGRTCTTTGTLSCLVTGLTNGTSYTFTVTATNSAGTGPASAPSAAVVPADVPGAPTGATGVSGDRSVRVSWTAPSDGGSPITGYTVTASPGGATASTTGATSVTVTGLSNGTAYTFTVTATNDVGRSAASAPSARVVPGDSDADGVLDGSDNCPALANTSQADREGDGVGDACDAVDDVDNTSAVYPFIAKLVAAGVTGGCDRTGDLLLYCPTGQVKRGDMAIFLTKSSLTPEQTAALPAYTSGFSDVTPGDYYSRFVRHLVDSGVTAGCGNGQYCPDRTVVRGDMAVFLAKTRLGSAASSLPAYDGSFTDVTTTDGYARHVRWVKDSQITAGCGNSQYCPRQDVTRAQMAVFLVKTFSI